MYYNHSIITDNRDHVLQSFCNYYRKTPLISTYVFPGLATAQVLILGAVLTFGGGGVKLGGVKIPIGRTLFNLVRSVDTVKSLFSAVLNLAQSSFYHRSSKRG